MNLKKKNKRLLMTIAAISAVVIFWGVWAILKTSKVTKLSDMIQDGL